MDAFLFPILLVGIAAMLFFQIRKQKRSMQAQQTLQNSLTEGDRVMTTSGLFGTVVGTSDESIELEIAPGVTTSWVRQSVREKVNTEEASDADDSSIEHEEATSVDETAADTTDHDSEPKAAEQVEKQKTS